MSEDETLEKLRSRRAENLRARDIARRTDGEQLVTLRGQDKFAVMVTIACNRCHHLLYLASGTVDGRVELPVPSCKHCDG